MAKSSFDPHISETIIPLVYGASVVLIDDEERSNYVSLKDVITMNQVGVTHFVPSFFQSLLSFDSNMFSTVKYIVFGGEELTKSLVEEVRSLCPSCTIVNLYGPAECTVNSNIWSLYPEETVPERVPLGFPLKNN
jgi:non-ribosomal peptide synthetase component F